MAAYRRAVPTTWRRCRCARLWTETPPSIGLSIASTSVAPHIMGIGPLEAARRLLARTGLTLADLDVIELNEVFAAQALACLQGLGSGARDPATPPDGSKALIEAIARSQLVMLEAAHLSNVE